MSTVYQKTYKPLAIWFGAFLTVTVVLPTALACRIPDSTLISAFLGCTYLSAVSLFVLIYAGGYVYWICGGPSFEEARDAGEEVRRAYAWAHLKRFLVAGAALAPYLVASAILGWPAWLDVAVFGVALIAAAVATAPIQFSTQEEQA